MFVDEPKLFSGLILRCPQIEQRHHQVIAAGDGFVVVVGGAGLGQGGLIIQKDIDCLIGNEEDFTAALGFKVKGMDKGYSKLDPANFKKMIAEVVKEFPNLKALVAIRGEDFFEFPWRPLEIDSSCSAL